MPLLPIPPYSPDISDYEASTSRDVLNVVPRNDGYGPFPSLASISASLGAPCRGALAAYKVDASVVVFAATATDLYLFNNTNFTWSKVSAGGTSYSAISTDDQWQFVQFNSLVFVTQANVPLQKFDITADSAFSNALGNPPQARYISVVGEFLVLTGLLSNPNRAAWSGLNDVNSVNSWNFGYTNFSDYQDFPDGGFCRGCAGGESGGVILQDTMVRAMTYLPGDPRVFQFDKIAEGLGIYGPLSLVMSGTTVLFFSLQGFQSIVPGGNPTPIGRERVDRTFLADLDASQLQMFMGIADPRSSRVLWVYKSVNGVAGQFDKGLLYDIALNRFAPVQFSGEYLFTMSQPGVTLEQLPSLGFTDLDTMTVSLDSFESAVKPQLAAFDTSHALNFFNGPNLQAILETAEQGTDNRRIKLKKGFRPITDAATVYGSASRRENQQQAITEGTESLIHPVTGICNLLLDTRYSRFKCRIPAGTDWSFLEGIEPVDEMPTGKR
jgi:hypothetical protein